MSFFACSVCSQVLRQPCCLTNCGHTFCFECLVGKVTQRPGDEAVIICPNCHVSSRCSSAEDMKTELGELVTATFIDIFGTEKISRLKRSARGDMNEPLSQKKMVRKCSGCRVKTSHFCVTCETVVCSKCAVHGHIKHELSDLVKQLRNKREELKWFIDELKGEMEESEKKKKELSAEFERIQKELFDETTKARVLKTAIERLRLVNDQIKDEEGILEVDCFFKLERELRNKLQLADQEFPDSTVTRSRGEDNLICRWLKEARGNKVNKVELLYRATRDGFAPKEFHSRCDLQGPTLVLLKTTEGKRGGGYSAQSWTSSNKYRDVSDPTKSSFLFSLDSQQTFKLRPNAGRSIKNNSDLGPLFGSGADLHISESGSYSFPGSYQLPSAASLFGQASWKVSDYEVWKVV
eukprot:TRINITY_DN734_c1_g2_i1.p1 TRINITY_DN734_c1_g2~~TRINITY_DN734_c1_g2_i1.p1  ORF type:complete len:417 (+),score=99.19 TRINITY_DN734_c1_g2_i1:28-1251(+)